MWDVITQNSVHGHKGICLEKRNCLYECICNKNSITVPKNDPCKVCLNIYYRDFFEILVNAIKNRNTYGIMF